MVRGRRRVLVALLLAALVPLLGGDLLLQALGGGIRGQSLSPAVLALVLGLLGGLIELRRPELRFGPLLLVNGLGFGLGSLAAGALDYGLAHPLPRLAAQAAFAVVWLTVALVAAWTLFVLWFPGGELSGTGWRRFFVAATTLSAAVALAGWLAGPERVWGFYGGTAVQPGSGGPFAGTLPWLGGASTALLALPLAALGALVQRYRRGTPVVRQQARWLLVAMAAEIGCQILGALLEPHGATLHEVGVAVSVGSQPLPMLGATVAILRYRLWEIDLVVSRALAYGALWAVLSALLLVPALAAGLLVGGHGAPAAVGIALLVTVVFQPARTRLERLVERLVHPHRARPRELLAGFSETLRTSGLDEVGLLLADTARAGVGAEWASAWLHAAGSLHPLGGEGGVPTALPADAAARLRASPCLVLDGPPPDALGSLWPTPPAAVVPLVAGDELVGLLACGRRRGDTLGPADLELLELLARGSALRLRNLRLEAQLHERLAEIEAQADELQRSRRRLVAVQDEERRRIERDLHDGVQQQLVSLAARLRRLGGDREPLLADLAAEAEQAVFALQELARGIYPTVLVDQGLTAALRTQAARTPLAVRIEADEALAGRRLEPELEAALYFVALEALTNAQKHAADASVFIRLERAGDSVLLEIADDGPGFSGRSRTGTGLQNMADRVAAAGGTLSLDSAPGAGTRIRACVPAGLGAQAAAADSRR